MNIIDKQLVTGKIEAYLPRIKSLIDQAGHKSNEIKIGVSAKPEVEGTAYASFGWQQMWLLWQGDNSYEAQQGLSHCIGHALGNSYATKVQNMAGDAEDIPDNTATYYLYLLRR